VWEKVIYILIDLIDRCGINKENISIDLAKFKEWEKKEDGKRS
jgi:transposase